MAKTKKATRTVEIPVDRLGRMLVFMQKAADYFETAVAEPKNDVHRERMAKDAGEKWASALNYMLNDMEDEDFEAEPLLTPEDAA